MSQIRQVLPARRQSTTLCVPHGQTTLHVTYGFANGRWMEVFCSPSIDLKVGTDVAANATDSCIAISMLLQLGVTLAKLAASFGEDRPEGSADGPPSSWLGAIARQGAELERELTEGEIK